MIAEYITRAEAIMAVTRAKLPDKTPEGVPIANGKRKASDCIRRLRAIPAADVRPVVRGRWMPHFEDFDAYDGGVEKMQYGFECSICGRWEEYAEPFCNCGADMREE